MPYYLTALATRDKPFRVIEPNAVQTGELLRLYTPILRAWRDSAARSMNAYVLALNTGELAGLDEEDRQTAAEIAALLALIQWGSFFQKAETWHRSKWLSSVSYATGVDARWMTAAPVVGPPAATFRPASNNTPSGVSAAAKAATQSPITAQQRVVRSATAGLSQETITRAVNDAVASSQSLARSLSDEARARIRAAVLGGVRANRPATEVAKQINKALGLGRDRARRIAVKEMDNFVKAATRARMAEAGLELGKWQHNTLRNYRVDHKARQGQIYALSDPIWAQQYEPGCRCQAIPVLRIGKFSGI